MNCFLLSHLHIDHLVNLALFGPSDDEMPNIWRPLTWRFNDCERSANFELASRIGSMLVCENACSVAVTCRDTRAADTLSSIDGNVYSFTSMSTRLTCAAAFKAIDCYEFVSSHHDDWPRSEAHAFCVSLRRAITRCIPGYASAPWVHSAFPMVDWQPSLRCIDGGEGQ